MLDLRHVRHRSRQPAIFMEEVTVGQVRRAAGTELILSPGKEHVELHFTAIDLASPENIHIQYRLDGVDSTWLSADSSRTAIYTDIPVGVHSFHIRATNGDGVWDRTGIAYNITQRPFFYETLGFRLGAVTAGFFVLAALYQLRLRQAAARVNAGFSERIAERNRLAGELHDKILQTVQATKMIADNARLNHSEDPRHLREAIDSISAWLSQATTEARAALNAIRRSASQKDDLAEAFRQAAVASRGTSRIRFVLSVQGTGPELNPIAPTKSIALVVRQFATRISTPQPANWQSALFMRQTSPCDFMTMAKESIRTSRRTANRGISGCVACRRGLSAFMGLCVS